MRNAFDIEAYTNEKKYFVPYMVCFTIYNKSYTTSGINCVNNFLLLTFSKIYKSNKGKVIMHAHNLTFDGSLIINNINTKIFKTKAILLNGNIYKLIIKINMSKKNNKKLLQVKKKTLKERKKNEKIKLIRSIHKEEIIKKHKKLGINLNNPTQKTTPLQIKKSSLSIELRCSYRLFPTKLEKANKILNTDKKINFDIDKISSKNWKKKHKKIEQYCKKDVKIVSQIIKEVDKFYSIYNKNISLLKLTIPSIALHIFETKFNEHKISTWTNLKDDRDIRPSLYGGRCEVFGNIEKGEIILHSDFKGMYAQIMHENFHIGNKKRIINVKKIKNTGFYNITYSQNMEIPILPTRINSKLLFLNGIITGLYWGEEINYFLQEGGEIIKINYGYEWEKEAPVFKKFSEHFLERRDEGIKENFFGKITSNSVFGRLSMNFKFTETKIISKKKLFDFKSKNTIIKIISINNIAIVKYKTKNINNGEKKNNNNVSYGAAITSKARIKLHKGFKEVIKNGGKILYCDTDSIFAAFKISEYKSKINTNIGEVFFDGKKKDTIIIDAIFAQPKAYCIKMENGEEMIKIKGFSSNMITYDEFKKSFINKTTITKKQSHFSKSEYKPNLSTISKSINLSEYTKRKWVNNDRKKTIAYNINDIIT